MKWASRMSEQFNGADAVDECVEHVRSELEQDPDFAVAFVSPHHAPDYEDLAKLIKDRLGAKLLIGCSGGGVIGGGKEVEDRAGLALTAAILPGVEIIPFHLGDKELPSMDAGPVAWEEAVHADSGQPTDFIVLADPYSIRADDLIAGLDFAFPGRVKIGGVASGGNGPGSNALFLDDTVFRSGAIGVGMRGAVQVDAIVAQGCRPIGVPFVVTKCDQNVMLELDEKKPMEILQSIFEGSDERDRNLINRALHVGVVTDPLKEDLEQGDFLIRNVMGIQQESGGIAVGELLREGQVVQFHVRDAQTAEQDLEALLRRYVRGREVEPGSGALLFSCLGRGMNMFGRPDHDTDLFRSEIGEFPLGGFFCNGEIGPVGPATFLHGFTSSFAIFSPR